MSHKKAKKQPEKRIYVVVPRFVRPDPNGYTTIPMECGRLIAQVAHVVSKLKLDLKMDPNEETTTIVLSVLEDKELLLKALELARDHIPVWTFEDTNPEFYGTDKKIPTALATILTHKKGKKYFWDLQLWRCNHT